MRILIWHGWLLEGSGSNVAAARSAQALRAAGHDVVLLCQERHPERHPFVDAFGTVTLRGAPSLEPNPGASPAAGRCVVLRPDIGPVLPVFSRGAVLAGSWLCVLYPQLSWLDHLREGL